MELNELRKQIDQIDQEMALLFEKRIEVASLIGEYKKIHHLDVKDENREKEVKEKNALHIKNKQYLPLYEEFISHVIKLSKKIQK